MGKKTLVKCVGAAIGVTLAMFLFRLVMAGLTDVTAINLHSLSFGWIYEHSRPLLLIVLIGLIWLALSMLLTQYSSDLSNKKQTASMTMIIFSLVGSCSGIIFFLGFRVIRAESIPPIGFSNFWRIVLLTTTMSVLSLYFNLKMFTILKRYVNPIDIPAKEKVHHVGFNGFWIPIVFFIILVSLGIIMIYPLFLDSFSFLTILKKEGVILAIVFTAVAQCAQIAFTLVKSKIADSARISMRNLLRVIWLKTNIKALTVIVLLSGLYLLSTLISVQYSSNVSNGMQTATTTSIIYGMIGGIFGFVQFSIFKVARTEKLPPLGFNKFWISLACITLMTFTSTLLNIGLLNELAKLR